MTARRAPLLPSIGPLLALALAGAALPARGAALAIAFTDAAGRPLADAVALLDPVGVRPAVKPMADVQISQSQRTFHPRVTLVTVGTRIDFPNFDTVRHHVYSLSPAKTFELKLYAGVPSQPVLFDKPGLAVLGCNIHDRMAAWVVVADTPWAARSGDDGRARLDAVPPGGYRLRAWHPALGPAERGLEQAVTVDAAGTSLALKLPVDAP